MSRFNRNPSSEYRAFVESVQEYAQSDQEPGEGVRRAIADALEDYLQTRFKNAWKVENTADTACFRRLITGEEEALMFWFRSATEERPRIPQRREEVYEHDRIIHANSVWTDSNH